MMVFDKSICIYCIICNMHTQTVACIIYTNNGIYYIHIQYAVHHSPINYFTHVEIFKFFVLHPMKTSDYMRACSSQTLFNFNKLIACARGYEFEEDPNLNPIWLRAHKRLAQPPKNYWLYNFIIGHFRLKSINFFKTVRGNGSSRQKHWSPYILFLLKARFL